MKQTRRALFAQNTELQSRLTACGPDATLSRKQLRERLKAARSEVDMLTARNTSMQTQLDAATAELVLLKKPKAKQPA